MRIVVVALAGLAIGGLGLVAPAGTQTGPSSWISDAAWAQADPDVEAPDTEEPDAEEPDEPVVPPLPVKKDEQAAREALKRRFTESGWIIFKAPEQLFSVALPGQPKVTAKPVAGHTPLIQHDYQVDPGDGTAYHTIVFEYPEGRAPEADVDYYRRVVEAYAKGSGSTVSKQGPARIDRQHGYEATTIDKTNSLIHLIDLLPSGDRIYMLVTAGPPGHAKTEEALRFRQSFHLIDPNATTEEVVEETLEQEAPEAEGPVTEETAPDKPLATEEDLMGEESVEEAVEEDAEDVTPEDDKNTGGTAADEVQTEETGKAQDEAPESEPAAEAESGQTEPDDTAPGESATEEPERDAPLYGSETPEPDAAPKAEEPATEPEPAPAEQDVAPAEEPAPEENATEPEAPAAPEDEAPESAETPDEKAPVPPLPDENAETVPEPDTDSVEEMAPKDEQAPETEEAPSEKPAEEKPAKPDTAKPGTEEAAPDEGESEDDAPQEEAPETDETPEAPAPSPYDGEVDPDEQLSI
ncbi:hypothetical protein A7A08_00055 [Methyloligella halotolerans]|uniref:Uncharacterized protein n=1 Tax=Methyloligella halotolerans TaxID=1177755 RepID=A0A1E2S1M1_9HYPH|nr:hypothetical protein [Methyloligella halotolerans]ODA68238.1 hypothetical protein A7A08_00055 [Methyloligella halotolerans]